MTEEQKHQVSIAKLAVIVLETEAEELKSRLFEDWVIEGLVKTIVTQNLVTAAMLRGLIDVIEALNHE